MLPEGHDAKALSSLTVIEDDEHQRPILDTHRIDGPGHLVLMVDLEASTPAERFRALAPLEDFLLNRAGGGDRVTVTAWPGPRDDVEVLCSVAGSRHLGAPLAQCLEALSKRKSAAHQAARQRGEAAGERLERAHRALARAIELTAGTGLPTRVLYLGASGGLAIAPGHPSLTPILDSGSNTSDSVGSVHYLVSLPRPGPLQSLARHAADLLAARAAEAQAAIYPLRSGRPPLGQDAWLASETGGRALDIRHLKSELEGLDSELERTFELVLARPTADSRFHRLEVESASDIDGEGSARFPRAFYAASATETLVARASAAARLGATRSTPGLVGRLGPPRRDGETLLADLRLERPTGTALTIQLAVSMPDGRLLQQNRTFDDGTDEIHLPLRFDHDARRLGLAARLEPGGEISIFSWPLTPAAADSPGGR